MIRAWISTHRSVVAATLSGTIIGVLIATLAAVSSGYQAQRFELGDGSVWVANGNANAIGRANTQVLALDTIVSTAGDDVEVVQSGTTILMLDRTNSKVDIVDPATSKVSGSVSVPAKRPLVAIAGENVVIGSAATGQIWILPTAQLSSFDNRSAPSLNLGADIVWSVTPQGMLFVYSAEARQVYRIDAANSDGVAETSPARFTEPQAGGGGLSITSVNGRWAVLDAERGVVLTSTRTVQLSGWSATEPRPVLQQASTSGDAIVIANTDGLVRVPFDSGPTTKTMRATGGTPAAPIVTGNCTFAAWSSGLSWRKCGIAAAHRSTLPAMPAMTQSLVFSANGRNVLLNDTHGGATWAVQSGGELINNWKELVASHPDTRQVSTENSDTPSVLKKTPLPPVATDDAFGARPGRTSDLPVLLNDYDPNGDSLVISEVAPIDPLLGRVEIVGSRQKLQITLTASASGQISFGYSITDGRGGVARATVVVTVRLPSENSPPLQVRQAEAITAVGGRVTTPVLGDWVDPDGDPIFLESVTTTAPDSVIFTPSGSVVFIAGNPTPGKRTVELVVSDGSKRGSGVLTVTVSAAGRVPIIVDTFVAVARGGTEITVAPLEHVRGGNGVLRLVSVPSKPTVTLTPNLQLGTFRFLTAQTGTYYVDFVVTDGTQTANGLVRIDVQPTPDSSVPPVTIPKTIFVHPLSTQTIDVADSDYDPAGNVLMVTGVRNVPTAVGIQAEVIEQRSVRVTLTSPLTTGPVDFNYTISNGVAESSGVITVIEIQRPAVAQPPIAVDDSVTVRVGDAVDIPVLANDFQPDGDPIRLDSQLVTPASSISGLLFVSGDTLRYLAPTRTGDFSAVYQISDSSGQHAQATVKISVREPIASTNNAPVPTAVTARVTAGETVRISIPLSGIDPDGDSTKLLGQVTNPQKGSVAGVGVGYFDYLAGDYSSGTDSFTYGVIDSLGARAVGTVRIGISSRTSGPRNPIAVADEVTIRPGGTVSAQVLTNDSNPDGGVLTITKVVPNSKSVTARIVGNVIEVTPPPRAGRYGLVYTIQNSFGGTSSAFLTVIVRTDAPRSYPVVTDTVLSLSDIRGRSVIDVNELKNVFFADGDVRSLGVALVPGYLSSAQLKPNKRITVTVEQKSQIIPFAVSHPDDPTIVSYGFIWVPGLEDALPQLNRSAPPITVMSESAVVIDLNSYVLAVGGRTVRLTSPSNVQATRSDGGALVVNDHTLRFVSASQYFGPASISFEVTDATSANDPTAHTASLVLPITVTPRHNQPPIFVGGVIDFAQGASRVIDLTRLTDYPHPTDVASLTYTVLAPLPTGFSYTLTGQKLTLTADPDAVKNTSTSIVIGVSDGAGAGKPASIQLRIVASTLPLAVPGTDTVSLQRGQSMAVDVLANDEATNPFPGHPLRVIAIRTVDGAAAPAGLTATANAANDRVLVAVSPGSRATVFSFQYEVADATSDPGRFVWGTLTVAVQDVPDPVSGVALSAFGNRTLTVRWSPGPSNNSPITGYRVSQYSGAGALLSTTSCASAVCDLTTQGNGPDNAVRLSVVAVNAIGSSAAAGSASEVWSDIVPPAPESLAVISLNGGLRISWKSVASPPGGSAVNNYRLTVGGAASDVSPAICSDGRCAQDVTGLVNGQTVAVSVSARNSANPSLAAWNSSASAGTPAGAPALSGTAPTAVVTDSTVTLSWPGVFTANGSQIIDFTAVAYTGATPTCSLPNPSGSTVQDAGTATTVSISGLTSDSRYSLVVLATNGVGCTPSSPVSGQTSPGVVTKIESSGPNKNGSVYDFSLSGAFIGESRLTADYSYYYRLVGTTVRGTQYGPISTGALLTAEGTQYGQSISVQVRACRPSSGSGAVCQANWSAAFALGVPVDPRVDPVHFSSAGHANDQSGVFTWTRWPTAPDGNYTLVQFACGPEATPVFILANTSQPGSCSSQVPAGQQSVLTIRVVANNGHNYDIRYDQAGNVQ